MKVCVPEAFGFNGNCLYFEANYSTPYERDCKDLGMKEMVFSDWQETDSLKKYLVDSYWYQEHQRPNIYFSYHENNQIQTKCWKYDSNHQYFDVDDCDLGMVICKYTNGPNLVARGFSILDINPDKIVDFSSNTMNSQTSCFTFCNGKVNVVAIAIQGSDCACLAPSKDPNPT